MFPTQGELMRIQPKLGNNIREGEELLELDMIIIRSSLSFY